ncbi:MAG TPA: hypothetical protein VGY13_10250 [Solirubrobacteraceae bacterium]|nr:hypothetical protein [Solirubrobacteraceae bacterium]
MGGKLTPLQQRDALIRERKNAYKLYEEQTQLRIRAEGAKGQRASRLREAEAALNKGQATEAQVEEAEADCASVEDIYKKTLDKANRALGATKRIDIELEQLYSDYFTDFAAEADTHSKLADQATNEMIAAYRRAQEAWARAQAAWTPVCHAVKIANMEPFPLTDQLLAPVIQGWSAKPSQIEVMDDADLNPDPEETALLEGKDVAG